MSSRRLLGATGIVLQYKSATVLAGVDLDLDAGSEVALVGRSGSGKTSLLLVLAGLIRPTSGRVDRREPALEVGMVFQSPSLLPELSAIENVALPLRLRGVPHPEAATRAGSALDEVGITVSSALPGELSGGQQQRVAVARVLALRPQVLLADEPTGALDREAGRLVIDALRRHVSAVDGAILVATHDLAVAGDLPNLVRLEDGSLRPPAAA